MLSTVALTGAGIVATATPAAAAVYDCNTNHKWVHGNYNGKQTFIWLPYYSPHKVTNCYVSPGDSGVDVRMIQDALVKCYGRDIIVDGEFGSKTKEALQHAQRVEGADDDGYYGLETRDALKWPRRYSSNSAYTGTCIYK